MTIQILKRRFVEAEAPKSRVCAKGRYKLIKIKGGIQISETPWFDNLILDSGLNRWGTGTIIAGAAIGTGTTAAATTDTGLETQTTYTTTTGTGHNTITAAGSSPYNNTRTVVYRTTLGALNGNYSEVGVGWASGSMFSRAIISPSISVASDEQLDIVYQLSVYPPLTDFTDTVNISGVDYDVIGRAANVNTTSGSAGSWAVKLSNFSLASISGAYAYSVGITSDLTINIGGSAASGTGGTATTDAYVNLSNQRTGNISSSLSQANAAGGIISVLVQWSTLANFKYQFDPVLPKDSTKTLVLNYSIDWARA